MPTSEDFFGKQNVTGNLTYKSKSPMEFIYEQIEGALKANLPYLAIATTVSIPDICHVLEAGPSTNYETYKSWFDRNAKPYFKNFGAHECYELRCGVSHMARSMGGKKKHSPFHRIIFSTREVAMLGHEMVIAHCGGSDEIALHLVVETFCESMIAAARSWEGRHDANPTVLENMKQIIRLRPEGCPPHISGLPVIS